MTLPSLTDIIELDFDELLYKNADEGAVSLSYYTSETDTTSDIYGYVSYNTDLQIETFGVAANVMFTIRKNDIARPTIHDKITYNGTEYTVSQIISGNKHNWLVLCTGDERIVPNNFE